MKLFRDGDSSFGPADVKSFAGRADTKLLASGETGASVHLYQVKFSPGGRTNWHRHSGPQWLFIVEGRVRVQRWGEPPQEVAAGDAVLFEPNEKHWHGAAARGSGGAHLAVNINAKTEWLEPVSEEDYGRI